MAGGPRPKPAPLCAGGDRPAAVLTEPGRGICPVCRCDRMVYDSSRKGRGLLVEHAIAKPVPQTGRGRPAAG